MSKITTTFLDGTTLWASSLNAIIEAINDNNDRIAALEALHNGDVTPTPEVTYTLTISVNDSTFGSVQGAGTYKEGQTVFITAIPNLGYKFSSWNDGVTTAVRTVIMSSNITLSATFVVDTVEKKDQLDIENEAVENYINGSKTMQDSSNLYAARFDTKMPYPDIARTDWGRPVSVNGGADHYNLIPISQTLDGKKVTVTGQVRMIKMVGTDNFRDLGGWKSSLGGAVKYGLMFRGAELTTAKTFQQVTKQGYGTFYQVQGDDEGLYYYTNHTATFADINTLLGLGVEQELDFRTEAEGSGTSPLGVDYHVLSVKYYGENYKNNYLDKTNVSNIAVGDAITKINAVASVSGGATYFHCTWGADRTGNLATIILGLLGVSEEDIKKDYELTSLGNKLKKKGDLSGIFWAINQMGESTLQKCFYRWVHTYAGVPQKTLDQFIKTMLGVTYDSSWINEDAEIPSILTMSAGELRSGCNGFIELDKDNYRLSVSHAGDTASTDWAYLKKYDVSGFSSIEIPKQTSLWGACYDEDGVHMVEESKYIYDFTDSNAASGTTVEVQIPKVGMKRGTANLKNVKYIAFNIHKGSGTDTEKQQVYTNWRVKLIK